MSDPGHGSPAGADLASSVAGVEKGFSFLLTGDAAFVPCYIWLQILQFLL